MRLSTIWTLKGMPLRERLNRTGEYVASTIAYHLPKRIAYWSYIHTGVRHMEANEVVPEVRYTEILERAGKSL